LSRILGELSDKERTMTGLHLRGEKRSDLIDAAEEEFEGFLNLRMSERNTRLMGKVKQALDMIEKGSYGICEACGEEIGLARLNARPVTQLCIQCKRRQEIEEKLRSL
jgi:DnaK suppressor protein